ncbi:MAG: DUF4386 domain-containing protein [Solirubrobacteraceae bacterium]|nr:DUF4386 domain-containing protein [Solirubrobacteraceae bacterium]
MFASDRSTARTVGWLFLGTFAFSIPGLLLYGPVLNDPDYVLGAGTETQISIGAFLEVMLILCNIGTAVVLYPVARRYSPRLALGYVASRVFESAAIVTGIMSVLSVLSLRDGFAASDPATLSVAEGSLVAFHDWSFLFGPGFCAAIGNGLILGTLMLRSGLLPRRIALLGPIAGSFAFVAAAGALLGVYELQSGPQFLLTVPEMIWEFTFGVVLITRGFAGSSARSAPTATPTVATAAA